jgi:hypothetical protein
MGTAPIIERCMPLVLFITLTVLARVLVPAPLDHVSEHLPHHFASFVQPCKLWQLAECLGRKKQKKR